MVLLYLGLIVAYGAIGLVPSLVKSGTLILIFDGILGTSTLLHYYYDGFIWKVREKETQVSLGLNAATPPARVRDMFGGRFAHLLKWSPLVVAIALLFATDLFAPSLSPSRKEELDQQYGQKLIGNAPLPYKDQERAWLNTQSERATIIAASVPGDRAAQLRAGILLANLGRHEEAVALLDDLTRRLPEFSDAHATLGAVYLFLGRFDQASACFRTVLPLLTSDTERAQTNLRLGIIDLFRDDRSAAEAHFAEAVSINPDLAAEINALRENVAAPQPAN
jgi:tetratricopeptide (TPR) repeat protein